jgi:HD-GYP domain-containing protein (c-di-GMP phosphodiesterase class II)
MRLVSINSLKPDMELAEPIKSNGRRLLSAGCSNLNRYKDRLENLGIHYVYIDDEISKDIEVNSVINNKTKDESKKMIKETFKNVSIGKKMDSQAVKDGVTNMVKDIFNNDEVLANLIDLKNDNDYTFGHSINVGAISLVIGKALGYNRKKLIKLGTGACLHDIGKTKIPDEILNKPGKLTDKEYEIMKQHPKLGYDILKKYPNTTATSLAAVVGHHEKVNGKGYPQNKEGNDIYVYGRIVAIADVFDALTSDRCYRDRWPVHKALDLIISEAGEHFDSKLVETFIRNVAAYPNGTIVQLSNGYKAIVKKQNKNFPQRPIVKILEDNNGNKKSKEINLMNALDITIVDTKNV